MQEKEKKSFEICFCSDTVCDVIHLWEFGRFSELMKYDMFKEDKGCVLNQLGKYVLNGKLGSVNSFCYV